ncbi:MAG: hypothetical protein H0T78_02650 [Longispora sp.]|nr:hypothetical protein [Longispora sp. (in: high G+C Gram-positive bacteria)]
MIRRAPRPTRDFLIIRNATVQDPSLSLKAVGLLTRILSRPDDWRIDRDSLAAECKEGVAVVRSALKELAEAGYLLRVKRQNEKGRWVTESIVFDTPQPVDAKPTVGEPTVGNQPPDPPGETGHNPSSDRRLETRRSVEGPVRTKELDLELQLEKSLSSAADEPASDLERDEISQQRKSNDSAAHQELAKLGVTGAEAARMVARYPDKGPGWWRHLGKGTDLAAHVAEFRREAEKAEESRQAIAAADALRKERLSQPSPGIVPATTPPPTVREMLRQQAAEQAEAAKARKARERQRQERRGLLWTQAGT